MGKFTEETLERYGWNSRVSSSWKEHYGSSATLSAARVLADYGQKYTLITSEGELWGEVTGKFRYGIQEGGAQELPVVGDWVAVEIRKGDGAASIHHILPRYSQVSRQAAGNEIKEQIVAANVDILFLVMALNHDFNLRRLERYLIMAWNSGVTPVVLLSKTDLCDQLEDYIAQVKQTAIGVDVIAVSALQNQGMEQLAPYLSTGNTCALTGSSGCGKSTLLNRLSGSEVQLTQDIREQDSKGRHTTTHREIFTLPSGAALIDTPGMRELQLWDDGGTGVSDVFTEIDELAKLCRFRDCKHEQELGCAVQNAIQQGELEPSRLANYHRTSRELKYQANKQRQQEMMRAKATKKKPKKSRKFTPQDWE